MMNPLLCLFKWLSEVLYWCVEMEDKNRKRMSEEQAVGFRKKI